LRDCPGKGKVKEGNQYGRLYFAGNGCKRADPGLRGNHKGYGGSGQGGKGTQSSFKEQLRQLLAAGLDLLRHATVNQFQVWRNGEMTTSMPVLILILLVVAAFWISLPLLVLGLFFGYKYRFAGPDVEDNKVSETMGRVSDAVHGMVEQVKDEFHRAARRDNDNKKGGREAMFHRAASRDNDNK